MWAIEQAEKEHIAERQHPHKSPDNNINQNSPDNNREKIGYAGATGGASMLVLSGGVWVLRTTVIAIPNSVLSEDDPALDAE